MDFIQEQLKSEFNLKDFQVKDFKITKKLWFDFLK